MNITMYLEKQFKNLNGVLHFLVDDLTEAEWLSRPSPGQNTLGYTVWHSARIQDHFLHAWVQGKPEVVENGDWRQWSVLERLGVGVGITLDESDLIARTASLADTLTYADEVHQAMLSWLAQIDEETLDVVPNAREHVKKFPHYQTPGYLEEIDNLFDLPIWALLMRPCMGHIHRHLGEIEITKDIVRKARA